MVEDPLAEALLVGRFKAGETVVVDRSPDAGLTIEPLAEKTPVEASARERAGPGATLRLAAARAESRYVCQACGAISARGRAGATCAARGTRSSRPCVRAPALAIGSAPAAQR